MQKDGKWVKKRQKIAKQVGQLGGKVVIGVAIGAAVSIGEEAIKEEGKIWDKEALDALFNEIV